MREETIRIYQFNELRDRIKENVINDFRTVNTDYEWWEFIYEDMHQIGLTCHGFDTHHGEISLSFDSSASRTRAQIIACHGKECETYKIAKDSHIAFINSDDDGEMDAINNEFLHDLEQEYLSILRNEYEYLTSDEAIVETIEANEYEFTENGEMW